MVLIKPRILLLLCTTYTVYMCEINSTLVINTESKVYVFVAVAACGVVNPADIVLVYDSTEVGPSGISDIQRGVTAFVQTDEMQNPNMRVGLISGDCPEVGSFPLNRYTDKSRIPKLFDNLPYSELDALVGELRRDGFHPENGGRKNARHIGILIITGKPKDPKSVRREANRAKRDGIELFVVGAGKVVDPGFLRSLASEPVGSHIIMGSDYSNFGLVGRELAARICESK